MKEATGADGVDVSSSDKVLTAAAAAVAFCLRGSGRQAESCRSFPAPFVVEIFRGRWCYHTPKYTEKEALLLFLGGRKTAGGGREGGGDSACYYDGCPADDAGVARLSSIDLGDTACQAMSEGIASSNPSTDISGSSQGSAKARSGTVNEPRRRDGGRTKASSQQQSKNPRRKSEDLQGGGQHRGSSSAAAHEAMIGKATPPDAEVSPGIRSDYSSSSSQRGAGAGDRGSMERRSGGRGGGGVGGGGRARDPHSNNMEVLPTDDKTIHQSESDYEDGTTSLDSTPRRTDGEMGSGSSSFSATSPLSSLEGGGGAGEGVSGGGVGGGGDRGSHEGDGTRRESSGTGRRRSSGGGSFGGGSRSRGGSNSHKNNGSSKSSSAFVAAAAASERSAHRGGVAVVVTGSGSSPLPLPTPTGVSARPAGVPFGASALSKNLSQPGRAKPRGLRPRSSFGSISRGGSVVGRSASNISPSSTTSSYVQPPASAGSSGGGPAGASSRFRDGRLSDAHLGVEARVAELLAPGVPLEVVVRASIKIESVMRVLIARGYVRRKLVSEVTAFSLIMDRGIEVIKHPYSGKAKPKNVTVNFVSRKGTMQLSWGGKSGVPLETIFGVTKGIKTDALRRVMDPERSDNCFSLHTRERTVDFEVDNPWLVLLVVRALRLFLGAHYDTLPAPTFFSHLCVRPAPPPPPPTGLAESPKKPLVWAGEGGHGGVGSPVKEPTSTPTERTSGDSASDDSGPSGRSQAVVREPSPWDTDVVTAARAAEAVQVAGREEGDEDEDEDEDDEDEEEEEEDEEEVLRAARELDGDTDCGSALDEAGGRGDARRCYPPAPDGQAPLTMTDDRDDLGVMATETAEAKRPAGEEEHEEGLDDLYGTDVRSPGGIMALFSAGKRGPEDFGLGSSGGRGEEELAGSSQAVPEEPGPLTASQLLATRGMSKRLSLAKKLSAANAAGGAALKGKRFDLMALPMDPTGQERRDRGGSEHAEPAASKRTQGMSISIGAGYDLPEEKNRHTRANSRGAAHDPERMAVVDDLNLKLQRRQYQTDMVRSKDQSVEDVRKRDDVRTAMLVTRSGVHRVTRKAAPSETR
eukprot:jgi/Undpi1/11381/HiC_scaffold_30.g13678.m1